jgi:hypothetical protein
MYSCRNRARVSITMIVAMTLAFCAACAQSAEIPSCFWGIWKSNEGKTLADMGRHPDIPEKSRALLGKVFFGRLVVIMTPSRSGSYFEGSESPSTIEFKDYEVVESGGAYVALRHKMFDVAMVTKWYCEGDEIYALTTRWEFREYFSRLSF